MLLRVFARHKKKSALIEDDEYEEKEEEYGDDDSEEIASSSITPSLPKIKNSPRSFFQKKKKEVTDLISRNIILQKPSVSRFSDMLASFDWEKTQEIIFSPQTRETINKLFIASLIGAVTYSTGKTIGVAVKGTPALKKIKTANTAEGRQSAYNFNMGAKINDEIQSIKFANLFKAKIDTGTTGSDTTKKAAAKDKFKVCHESKQKSSLPLKLTDTIVMQDTIKSIAAVAVRNSESLSFREGDSIQGLAEIGRIDDKKITIKNLNSGDCEYIMNDKGDFDDTSDKLKILSPKQGNALIKSLRPEGIKIDGNKFTIKKSLRNKILSPESMSTVLTQARAIQINNPDGTLAFKISEIVPDSIYSHLDIQENDIITQINGEPIRNLNQVMSLFGKIKDIDHFELKMNRGGMEQNFEYDFE